MRAIRLSSADLAELTQIMAIGNTALKQCAEMMGLQHREFRGKLFRNKLDTSKLSPEQLQKLKEAIPLIMAVRDNCEEKVRAGFKRMVMQQAYIAANNNYDPANAREEFIQEAQIAVLDAVYGYTDTNIKLSTFVWRCIRRRIVTAINRLNPLCPLTNEALEVVRRVQEVQDCHPNLTDEEAVQIIGLT